MKLKYSKELLGYNLTKNLIDIMSDKGFNRGASLAINQANDDNVLLAGYDPVNWADVIDEHRETLRTLAALVMLLDELKE